MEIIKIEQKLSEQVEAMLELLPPQFRVEFKEKAFIGGGCFYSMKNDIKVNDYDFFVTDKDFADRLVKYFKTATYKSGYKGAKVGIYHNKTLTVTKYAISIGNKHQIVTKFCGTPEEVVNNFDFKHNMFAYVNGKVVNYTDWKYLDSNKIRFNEERGRDISGTIQRIPKMIDKGFIVTKGEISKMLNKLAENGFDEREMEIINERSTY